MDTAFETLLNSLLASGPIAAVLFYMLYKIWSKLEDRDKQITELNAEIRDLERENVEALNKLTIAINELKDFIKYTLDKK